MIDPLEKEPVPGLESQEQEIDVAERARLLERLSSLDTKAIPEAVADHESSQYVLNVLGSGQARPEQLAAEKRDLDRVLALEQEKSELAELVGKEQIPDGVVIAKENGTSQQAGLNLRKRAGREPEELAKAEQAERAQIIKEWQQRAVEDFSHALKTNWHTKDAMNLGAVLAIIKVNVPKVIEQRTKDFVEGKVDVLPALVWIHWKSNSFLDRLLGKPNQIRELKLSFDEQEVSLAKPEELEVEEEAEQLQPSADRQADQMSQDGDGQGEA